MTQKDKITVNYNEEANRFLQARRATTHAAFFVPYLEPGMTVLDCGCGPGSITADLAQIVHPGDVTGIDLDMKRIKLAQKHTASNVHFKIASICQLPFPDNYFDAVFIHGVVEYLDNPIDAFREVWRVLKPDGMVGSRHGDWGGFLLAPPEPNVELFFQLFEKLMEHSGGNPKFGRYQVGFMQSVGFKRIVASASYDCWTQTPEHTRDMVDFMMSYCVSPEFAEPVIKLGLADQTELQEIRQSLKRWGENPNTFAAEAWGEAVAWKQFEMD